MDIILGDVEDFNNTRKLEEKEREKYSYTAWVRANEWKQNFDVMYLTNLTSFMDENSFVCEIEIACIYVQY